MVPRGWRGRGRFLVYIASCAWGRYVVMQFTVVLVGDDGAVSYCASLWNFRVLTIRTSF